jgi:hypothetical protein
MMIASNSSDMPLLRYELDGAVAPD